MTAREAQTTASTWIVDNLQKIGTAIVIALLIWVGSSLNELQIQSRDQSVRIEHLSSRLDQAAANRYTSIDAARDFARIEVELTNLKQRMDRFER